MKKLMAFDLSDEAVSLIKAKAKIFKISEDSVLESIIMEFSKSTDEEKRGWLRKREKAFNEFILVHPDATIQEAWKNGWNRGWLGFQTRKLNSLFAKFDAIENLDKEKE